jgi:hypothetical protein
MYVCICMYLCRKVGFVLVLGCMAFPVAWSLSLALSRSLSLSLSRSRSRSLARSLSVFVRMCICVSICMYVHTCYVLTNPPIPSSPCDHIINLSPNFFLHRERANPRVRIHVCVYVYTCIHTYTYRKEV